MSFRDTLEKNPLIGWGIAAILLVVAAVFVYRTVAGSGEQRELSQMITIRCRETGKEWKVLRGSMEKELMLRPHPLNPDEGLVNPETGKRTGFPVDDWKELLDSMNQERADAMGGKP
jgi:hypothetical protein